MKCLLFLFIIQVLIPPIFSVGTLQVKIIQFSKLSGTDFNGACCDIACSCDPYFSFCWRNFGTLVSDTSCPGNLYIDSGYYSEQNTINPGSTFAGGVVSNPLGLRVDNAFTGYKQLFVQMWDRDFDGNNDLMDRFALNIIAQSTSSLSAETTFLGVTSGTMTISFTIACDANYYGLLCNVFCIAQNSAQFGYYTCNPSDGSRVCTSDYTGSECKTPICTFGCLNGGCTVPNQCNCDNGWMGTICDQCIPLTGCDSVNGFCTSPFTCTCNSGYAGTLCNQDLFVCDHNPGICNNGACTNTGTDSYQCTCTAGYTGMTCDTGIDLCVPASPCQNGGSCINHMTDYDCDCVLGYEGKNCELVIDNCPTSNCSFGTCQNEVGSFSCDCSDGYTGFYCENEINECAINPCGNNGNCTDFVNGYVCECTDAQFVGRDCTLNAIDHPNPDYCSPEFNSCLNGASCSNATGDPPFNCSCINGFIGIYCGDNQENCPTAMNPCNNSANCIDLPGNSFRCQCLVGYDGTLCQDDINECNLSPCNNDGNCTNFPGGFNCTCAVGFEGPACNDRTDYCAMDNFCLNNATCINNRFNYTCQCVLGFRGTFCGENINDCIDVSCINGTCVDLINDHRCDCIPGFTGIECSIEINECATEIISVTNLFPNSSSVCGTFGECTDLVDGFECTCEERYTGTYCRQGISCATNPCNQSNVMECVNATDDAFECRCLPGFTGLRCDINIDECNGFPCHNGGICVDGRNEYTCDCPDPWRGLICLHDNTSCLPNPCLNGGTCTDVDLTTGTISCNCPSGYTGSNCESDIDECSLPVLNTCPVDVNCTNTDGSYFCQCPNSGIGLNPLTCNPAISAAITGIPLDDFVYYIIIPVSGFLVLIILILLCFLICACCIIRSMKTKTVEVREDGQYESLDVNNYEEIPGFQVDEGVTNNPAYAGMEFGDLKPATAVTSNPQYERATIEENVYLPDPNLSISQTQKIDSAYNEISEFDTQAPKMKSAYNEISDFPAADEQATKGIYNEVAKTSDKEPEPRHSLYNSPEVAENEYGDH